jgi:hypothetical protein
MAFLQRLLTRYRSLRERLKRREETLVEATALQGEELITRFLHSRNQYSAKAGKPKPAAFNPAPYDELSTAHITGLQDEAVWLVSRGALGTQPGRDKIYARADLAVAAVQRLDLKAVRDNDPFERHTVIVGWPKSSDVSEQKERWLQIALELSQEATLHIRSAPVTAGDAAALGSLRNGGQA